MANKRNLDCMDTLVCSKMPRRENEHDQLSTGICKPGPLPSYSPENSVQYTGSYLAYRLRNQQRTDPSGVWSQSQPYLQAAGEPSARLPPAGDRLHQTEPEAPSLRSANAKDQLDLVKDLMNVRAKWVTFVERQKNLRNGQNLSGVLCPAANGKHNLIASALGAVQSCGNVAYPQAVYRSSFCCSGVGCSLQNSDNFHRRGQETEWKMPTPVTSSCLIANNDHLLHNQQCGNSLSKNKLLHHGSNIGQVSSVGRISRDAERLSGAQSSLCHRYGPYNGNVLQDPRYSLLPYKSPSENVPRYASVPNFHNPLMHMYSANKGQQVQPPFYCDKLSPPKFPLPIQPKVVHSQNTTTNQQNAASYSLLQPQAYRAQTVGCPYPVRGVAGQMPISNSTFVPQLSPGSSYPQNSESLGYPVQPPQLQKGVPTTGPSIHPKLETVPQAGQLALQSPSRMNSSAAPQDPASGNTPSLDTARCRPHIFVDAQVDTQCYSSLNSLPNKEYIGQQQLASKHSAFQPVLSGKSFKGTFERSAISPADQRPKDIYTHECKPSIDISPNRNHGISTFSKENEIVKSMLGDCELGSLPKSKSISPSRRTSEMNFLSARSSEDDKRQSTSSPPMPVINNVFSLAPYRCYLEATGLFFPNCQKCQSDCNLNCSCPSENQTKHCGNAELMNVDPHKESPMKLTKVIGELQCNDAESKQSNPSVCAGACNKETVSGMKREEGEQNPEATLDQDINLSPTLGIQNPTPLPSCSSAASHEVDDVAGKLEMTKTDAESVLDLSVKSRNPCADAVQQQFSASPGCGEALQRTGEMSIENMENKGEPTSHGGRPGSEVGDTQPASPSVPCKPREEWNSKEVLNKKIENTAGSVSNKEPEAHLESNGTAVVKTSNSSSSSLTVDLNRCEIPRPAPTRVEGSSLSCLPEGSADGNTLTVLGSVNPLRLIMPLQLIVPDEAKSALSPAPEAKKSPCETKVCLLSRSEPGQSKGDMYMPFVTLHQSLCCMIAQSVAEVSAEVLRACLQDFESRSRSKEDPKARSSSKFKNSPRNEALKMSKSQEIWLNYRQVKPTMCKVLSHLETYQFARRCPFPHVIRAGATFIPIYLVKEKLFSSLKGTAIDQVFQEHKIELRPTTLSEEKILQNELQLQRCSSRLIKLLSLKQLPEIYPNLLNVLWHSCAKIHLGVQEDENLKKTAVTPTPAGESGTKSRTDSGSAGKKKTQKEAPAEHPSSVAEKPNDGEARLGAKLRKRRKNDSAAASPANSNPVSTNPSSGSPPGPRAKSSTVHRSVTSCSTKPDQDVVLPKEPRPPSQKLQKSTTKEFLKEKAHAISDFEKKGSALLVKLNRLVIKNDNKGPAIPHSVKIKGSQIKGSQMLIKKNSTALRPTRSTSRMLHLRDSIVRLKFEKLVQATRKRNLLLKPITAKKTLFTRNSQQLEKRKSLRLLHLRKQDKMYPNLVGKRIRHLYEENDKSESWYKGVVVRVYEKHQNPLKTVFEVKYDSEPDWQYYLELLQDYEKGWLRVDN